MKWPALLLALLAAGAAADSAYVSDELVLGVYAEQNGQGQRLTTLHSGSSVETLAQSGEFTQVRLSDGTVGWVKSAFLTSKEPATVRIKQLEEELDRGRATTPALAEAAARSEVERLKQQLSAKQAEIDAARGQQRPAASSAAPLSVGTAPALLIAASAAISLLVGFWLGYATLARRVKHKFGGIKVY
ncbi:MAG TPA: TIGR04211 family SH3 domain-containing protein [Steroidobacteraceae bacterium]